MLKTGSSFFLRVSKRTPKAPLKPSIVVAVEGEQIAVIPCPSVKLSVGQELVAFYDQGEGFIQQPVRVLAAEKSDAGPVVTLVPTGDPVSAECRRSDRVNTLLEDATVYLGASPPLTVRDISSTGFAVFCDAEVPFGEMIDVDLRYGEACFQGRARVKSMRRIRDTWRYGLHCPEGATSAGDLPEGLRRVALAARERILEAGHGAS